MSKAAKPNTQIPPLDPETRNRLALSLQQQQMAEGAAKMLQGPPAMIYAGFEGGMSLS